MTAIQSAASIESRALSMTINGKKIGPMQVPAGLSMIDFLHEYLGLTGSRLGCGQGICHACVVIVDHADGTSEEARTCINGAHFFDGLHHDNGGRGINQDFEALERVSHG